MKINQITLAILGFIQCLFFSNIGFAVTVEELSLRVEKGEAITIIDIRDNASFQRSHIPGAINIPYQICESKQLPELGNVVVYGDGLDFAPAVQAAEALNKKSGIRAEILEGGFGTWEASTNLTTHAKGISDEAIPYISYQQLTVMTQNNPDIVFVDLRKSTLDEKKRSENSGELTNISESFPNIPVVESPFDTQKSTRNISSPALFVLIDNGDGLSEQIAQKMKSAGIKRFVILAGGENILKRKGASGIGKK